MVCTSGIRSMIRDDKLPQIPGALQAGGRQGMQTLNAHLAEHVKAGRITQDQAFEYCSDVGDLITLLGGSSTSATAAAQARATTPATAAGPGAYEGGRRPADNTDVWQLATPGGGGT
jgi:twitching motility protein PilT